MEEEEEKGPIIQQILHDLYRLGRIKYTHVYIYICVKFVRSLPSGRIIYEVPEESAVMISKIYKNVKHMHAVLIRGYVIIGISWDR